MSKPITGVKADVAMSYRKLEYCASQIRHQLGLDYDEPVDALNTFEDLHKHTVLDSKGVEIPLDYGIAELVDTEGYTRYDGQHIEIVASLETYKWLERRHPRGAYFLAHELGHCGLHTDQLIRLSRLPMNQQAAFHRGHSNHTWYQDTEWQANNFASALLMPAKGLDGLEKVGLLNPLAVSTRFHVSAEAASYRLALFNARRGELIF